MIKLQSRILLFWVMAVIGITGSVAVSAKTAAKAVVVARVKGHDIGLNDLTKATAPYKARYEKQGYDFASAQGKLALQRLQQQVIQEMVARELLQQAARDKKITVSKKEIDDKVKSISKKYGDEKGLYSEVSTFGWTKQDLLDDIKKELMEDKFINAFLMKGKDKGVSDEVVNGWLQENAKDGVEILFKVDSPSQGDGLKSAEKAGLEYYRKNSGDAAAKGAEAKATNYGCHTQVDIIKDGKIVKSLGYGGGGDVYEID